MIGARFLWVFPATYLSRLLPGMLECAPTRRGRPRSSPWSGMRGAVSLAAALALPLTTDAGTPFPDRELVIFLTFSVILGTLLLQGLTLPSVIRALRLRDDELEDKEEAKARIYAAEAALARLEELVDEDWVREDTADRLRAMFNFRRSASARASTPRPTATSRTAPSATSACCASCSTPSAKRSSTSSATGGSTTRSCAGSSAISTSRKRG